MRSVNANWTVTAAPKAIHPNLACSLAINYMLHRNVSGTSPGCPALGESRGSTTSVLSKGSGTSNWWNCPSYPWTTCAVEHARAISTITTISPERSSKLFPLFP